MEFHLKGTFNYVMLLSWIFDSSTYFLNYCKRVGEARTNLTAFLILRIDSCMSFKPSFTTRFNIWAQHLTCMYSPCITLPFQSFICFFKYVMATSFELALSTVIVKTLLIPHSARHFSIFCPITSPLWLAIWQKFKILLCNF